MNVGDSFQRIFEFGKVWERWIVGISNDASNCETWMECIRKGNRRWPGLFSGRTLPEGGNEVNPYHVGTAPFVRTCRRLPTNELSV